MMRTAALALWSTVIAVGGAGAAAALLVGGSGDGRPPSVRPVDPGAPTRLARDAPPAALDRAAAPPPTAVPTGVRLPSIGVTARVTAVGVDRDGEVAIPERVDTVGWYRFSARPGAASGSTVLVGHVDLAERGAGALFRLRDVGRGDRIAVSLTSGRTLQYRVVSRAQYPKSSVPLGELFSVSGAPRLTVITCGGSFDGARRSYRDNIVVTAVPA